MSMINTWINAVTKPKETFAAEKANASIGTGAIYYLIGGLISGVIFFIINMIFSTATGGATVAAVAGVTGIIGIIITPILTVIASFIIVGIYFILAKIFGGTGSYSSLFYLMSLYAVPLSIFSQIPILGLLVGLYALYLDFLVIKESQQLSTGKAIAVILIPIIIIAILVIILGVAILSLYTSMPKTGFFGLA